MALAGLFLPLITVNKIYVLHQRQFAKHDKSKYKFRNLKSIIILVVITVCLYAFCMDYEIRLYLGIMSGILTFLFFAANYFIDFVNRR